MMKLRSLLSFFRNIKTVYQRTAEKNRMAQTANEFVKHYELLYKEYITALNTLDNANMSYGAVIEAEYIGKRFYGIEPEAFQLIRYKVENE